MRDDKIRAPETETNNENKGQRLRLFLSAVLIVAVVAVIALGGWFAWSRVTYKHYRAGMTENEFSTFITPRYAKTDASYTYLVKYPDLLSFTGNLAVSDNDDKAPVQAFIVWPSQFGRTQYGLLINDGGTGWQIYTDKNGMPLDVPYQEIIDRYADDVQKIVEAAWKVWKD